jgi:hypothetical protein
VSSLLLLPNLRNVDLRFPEPLRRILGFELLVFCSPTMGFSKSS